jgi:hypothetical protein
VCSQSAHKRKLVDGREASKYWGGNSNPDGSAKKANKYVTAGDKLERGNALRQEKAVEKQAVRARFIKHRDAQEKAKTWQGPRTFEEWLLKLGEQVLDDRGALSVDEQKLEAARKERSEQPQKNQRINCKYVPSQAECRCLQWSRLSVSVDCEDASCCASNPCFQAAC